MLLSPLTHAKALIGMGPAAKVPGGETTSSPSVGFGVQ